MPSVYTPESSPNVMVAHVENKVCLGCHKFSLDILPNAVIRDIDTVTANQLAQGSRLSDYQLEIDEIKVFPKAHHHGLDYKISVVVQHRCNSDYCYNFDSVMENFLYDL